jgi:DNA polymerase-4
MRKIIHIDMDAFYASVEQRDRPELRGQPVVVAWSTEARGVVVAASYEARKFGIHSAMPARRAVSLCPHAHYIVPDFEKYRRVSRQIREIFLSHTPLVEPLSLDEAYLDVTHELTGIPTATETARVIRAEIRRETGLTASAGVAPNKFLAKIASDWKKPDGLFVIRPGDVEQFLLPLPVGKIPGVGKVTEKSLLDRGIVSVGDLQKVERPTLVDWYGKFGDRLWELARGIDEHPVEPEREAKSMSCENTFSEDIPLAEVAEFLDGQAPRLLEMVGKKQLIGRTVTVKLRRSDFTTATRQITPPVPPTTPEELRAIAHDLLTRFSFGDEARFRLAGLGLSNFMEADAAPPRLF